MFSDNQKTKNLMHAVPVVVLILVSVVLIFTFVLYNNEIATSRSDFKAIGSTFTGHVTSAMEVWLNDQLTIVGMIAEHPAIVALCEDPSDSIKRSEAKKILEELNIRFPHYETIPIAAFTEEVVLIEESNVHKSVSNGEFILDTVGGSIVGRGGLELSYIKTIYEGQPYYISEVYNSINSGEPIVALSMPVKSGDQVVGVAVATPKIEYFTSRFVTPATHGNSGYMFIVDGRGLTVSHPDTSNIMKDYDEQGTVEKRIISNVLSGQTYFQDVYDDHDKSYYSKRMPRKIGTQPHDWFMVFTMNTKEIYRNADRLLRISMGMLIGGTVCIVVILVLYTGSIQKNFDEINRLELSRKLELEVAARTSQLAEMAIRDSLTDLYNHKATYKALSVAITGSRVTLTPLSVIMIDLDNFKSLNDTYGHPFGDLVLKETAEAIRSAVRTSDIVGRYGGEEFLVILPGAHKDSAVKTAMRIQEELKKLIYDNGVVVTASVGVATWIGEDIDQLIARVDKLLYQAKRKGRNRIESSLNPDQ